VEVIPRADLGDEEALRAFVAEVRTIAPRATGEPVINVSAGEAVVAAFRRALIGAAVATLLLLLLALRNVPDASRVMIPLLLAGAMTGAATVVFGIPFNYANVIALPLLLGVGVDNGIHMVHRRRAGTAPDRDLLETSTARAVLYASLTTIFSFGNLAFSSHPGTASMGRLLTIGMLAVLICTLVVLPALETPRRALR
jgi:predicted RND superfamily exporter protein